MEEAARLKAELTRRSKETLRLYEPLPKVLDWHKSEARIRLLAGGNRAGKTTCGAVEVGWWATETHPFLTTPTQPKILCVENQWALVGDPMWAKLAKQGGVKLPGTKSRTPPILPKRLIEHISWTDKGHEIPSLVQLRNGTSLTFKSCDSGREKFEGAEFDLVWCDEEMADTLVFQEIIRSLIDRGGKLISTFTPLARGRPMLMLHEMAEDPDAASMSSRRSSRSTTTPTSTRPRARHSSTPSPRTTAPPESTGST
jgi:phage terminase large subunit-like protein